MADLPKVPVIQHEGVERGVGGGEGELVASNRRRTEK